MIPPHLKCVFLPTYTFLLAFLGASSLTISFKPICRARWLFQCGWPGGGAGTWRFMIVLEDFQFEKDPSAICHRERKWFTSSGAVVVRQRIAPRARLATEGGAGVRICGPDSNCRPGRGRTVRRHRFLSVHALAPLFPSHMASVRGTVSSNRGRQCASSSI